MEGYAIIKNEPLAYKDVSADYNRGYNEAVEKACELYEEELYTSKRFGVHGIPQRVNMFRQALKK